MQYIVEKNSHLEQIKTKIYKKLLSPCFILLILTGFVFACRDNNKEEYLMSSQSKNRSNKLIHEKSPYLLQHAYNPVNWYPWGEEAFNKAAGGG